MEPFVEQLIRPLSREAFLQEFMGQKPFAAPFQALQISGLLSWHLLEHIFMTGHSDCWLAQQGRLPQDPLLRTGRLKLITALQQFQNGHTVLVRHAERAHGRLADIGRQFHRSFQSPVDIQLYFTPAGKEGFDWHYDVEDVFVLQSRGEKEFRLLPNTVTARPLPMFSPTKNQFHKEKKAPEIRCHLKAGDWLYIPSGYWHKAKALTDSFHLSVGVLRQTSVSSQNPILN